MLKAMLLNDSDWNHARQINAHLSLSLYRSIKIVTKYRKHAAIYLHIYLLN